LDLEIKRQLGRTRLRKEKRGEAIEESSTTSTLHIEPIQEESNMVEERQLPPKRTLGDYAMQQEPRDFFCKDLENNLRVEVVYFK